MSRRFTVIVSATSRQEAGVEAEKVVQLLHRQYSAVAMMPLRVSGDQVSGMLPAEAL
jgi:hypothetical protein